MQKIFLIFFKHLNLHWTIVSEAVTKITNYNVFLSARSFLTPNLRLRNKNWISWDFPPFCDRAAADLVRFRSQATAWNTRWSHRIRCDFTGLTAWRELWENRALACYCGTRRPEHDEQNLSVATDKKPLSCPDRDGPDVFPLTFSA